MSERKKYLSKRMDELKTKYKVNYFRYCKWQATEEELKEIKEYELFPQNRQGVLI